MPEVFFWQVQIRGWGSHHGGSTAIQLRDFPLTAFVDTGSAILQLPEAIVEEYLNQLGNSTTWRRSPIGNMYSFQCSKVLPDLLLHIGSYIAEIPDSSLRGTPIPSDGPDNNQCKHNFLILLHCSPTIKSCKALRTFSGLN